MSSVTKKISEGLLYSSGSRLIIRFFSMIGYFLIVNNLSVHDYGVFVLLVALTSPATPLVFLSLDSVFMSSCAKARGAGNIGYIKGLIREYFLLIGGLTIVFGLGAFVVYSISQNFYWAQYFWVLLLFVISQLIMNSLSLLLGAHEKFKEISIVESIESISRFVFVVVCALAFHFSVTTVLLLYTFGKLTSSALSLWYVLPLLRELRQHSSVREKHVLGALIKKSGKWEISRSLLEQMVQPLRISIIKFFVQVEGVAVYDFARSMYSVLSGLIPMKRILFPIISRFSGDKEKGWLIIQKAKKFTLFTNIILYCGSVVFIALFIPFLFPAYAHHILFICFLLLHIFIDVYKLGQDALLYAYNEQKFLFQTIPFFLVLQIIIDIICMRLWGVLGIGISWHIYAFFTGFCVNWYLYKKNHLKKYPWTSYYHFDEYDKMIVGKIVNRLPAKLQYFVPSRFKTP